VRRKHWNTTRQDRDAAAAPDLVDRNFCAAEPNTLWVADLTYVNALQGILYLAVVLEVFSRKVVGWQMADRMTTDLVLTAFEMGFVAPRHRHGPADPPQRLRVPNTPPCGSPNASPTPAWHPPPDRSVIHTTTLWPNRSSAA
jgi:transposase InsO family protein